MAARLGRVNVRSTALSLKDFDLLDVALYGWSHSFLLGARRLSHLLTHVYLGESDKQNSAQQMPSRHDCRGTNAALLS